MDTARITFSCFGTRAVIKTYKREWTPVSDRNATQRNITTFVDIEVFNEFENMAKRLSLTKGALARQLIEKAVSNVSSQ